MASITCGHCKDTHVSVQEVKDCFSGVREALGEERKPVSDMGIYMDDNGFYWKVQKSRESGRLYAKKGRTDLKNKTMVWDYVAGGLRNIKEDMRITADQAGEFGKLFNFCINCSRELTREESMDRGYGPTCAEKNGWPYDHGRG